MVIWAGNMDSEKLNESNSERIGINDYIIWVIV